MEFGASGSLRARIEAGKPADLFEAPPALGVTAVYGLAVLAAAADRFARFIVSPKGRQS
jgi:hypothetical protein